MLSAESFAEFSDPRLVALYDTVCASRDDFDFYLALVRELRAHTIVDLGCGTGTFACELAALGHEVIGVDPAPAMLAIARGRPGGDRVRWLEGDARELATDTAADLVIMTGHVAQVIPDEDAWRTALAGAFHVLRDGGHLAFESRDPRAEAWRAWTPQMSRRQFEHPALGPFETWFETTAITPGRVEYDIHYILSRTGEALVSHNALRFPSQRQITASVEAAGFEIEHIYGDWDRRPVSPDTPELIYLAIKAHVVASPKRDP